MSISFDKFREKQQLTESELKINKILIDLFKHPMFDYSQSICKLNFDENKLREFYGLTDKHIDGPLEGQFKVDVDYIKDNKWKQCDVIIFGYNFGEPTETLAAYERENEIPEDVQGKDREKHILKNIHANNIRMLEKQNEKGHLEKYLEGHVAKFGRSWFDKWQEIFNHCTGTPFVIPKNPRTIPLMNLVTWSSYDAGSLKGKFKTYYRDLIENELKNQIKYQETLRQHIPTGPDSKPPSALDVAKKQGVKSMSIDLQKGARERGVDYYLAQTKEGDVKIKHGGEQIIEIDISTTDINKKVEFLAEEAMKMSELFGARVNKAFMRVVKPKIIFWCIRPTDFEDDGPNGPKGIIKKSFGLRLQEAKVFDLMNAKTGKIAVQGKGKNAKELYGAKSHEVYTDNKNRLWICMRHLSAPGPYAFRNVEKEMVGESFKKYVQKMGLKTFSK